MEAKLEGKTEEFDNKVVREKKYLEKKDAEKDESFHESVLACENFARIVMISLVRSQKIPAGSLENLIHSSTSCNTLGVWLPHLHLHFINMSIIHPFMSLDCMKHAFETLQYIVIFHVCMFRK